MGDKTFELTRNEQIWPCMLKELIGGKWGTNAYYLFVNDIRCGPQDRGSTLTHPLGVLISRDGWMQWQCFVACVLLSCVSVFFFLLFSSLALHQAGSIDATAGTWLVGLWCDVKSTFLRWTAFRNDKQAFFQSRSALFSKCLIVVEVT